MNKRLWYYCVVCEVYTKSPDLICSKCENPINMEWNKPGTIIASSFNINKLEKGMNENKKWYKRIIKKLTHRRKKEPWESSGWKVFKQ